MSSYEIYIFCLCFIVFALLTILFTTLITYIVRLIVRLIRNGAEDEKIKIEYSKKKRFSKCWNAIGVFFSSLICIVLFVALMFSLLIGASEDQKLKTPISLKVVLSGSMSYKHEKNTQLELYDVNDQIQMFDLIVLHELPPEEELELFDTVMYEVDDRLIVHRIVGIEEPNEKHPDQRYFLLQGDANDMADKFPVLYSQMRGIYRGQRVPFIGSFITFMQSPAGWLCVLLILFATIATPIVEHILEREKEKRWRLIQKQAVLQKYNTLLEKTSTTPEKAPRLDMSKLYFLRLKFQSSKNPKQYKQYTFKFAKTDFFFKRRK